MTTWVETIVGALEVEGAKVWTLVRTDVSVETGVGVPSTVEVLMMEDTVLVNVDVSGGGDEDGIEGEEIGDEEGIGSGLELGKGDEEGITGELEGINDVMLELAMGSVGEDDMSKEVVDAKLVGMKEVMPVGESEGEEDIKGAEGEIAGVELSNCDGDEGESSEELLDMAWWQQRLGGKGRRQRNCLDARARKAVQTRELVVSGWKNADTKVTTMKVPLLFSLLLIVLC